MGRSPETNSDLQEEQGFLFRIFFRSVFCTRLRVICLCSISMPFAPDLYLHRLDMDVLVTLLGFKKKIFHYFFPCFFLIDQLTEFVGFCDFSSLIRDFSELTWLVVTILNHLAIVGFRTLGRLHCSVPHNSTLLNCFLQDFFFLRCTIATLCGSLFLTYRLSPYL